MGKAISNQLKYLQSSYHISVTHLTRNMNLKCLRIQRKNPESKPFKDLGFLGISITRKKERMNPNMLEKTKQSHVPYDNRTTGIDPNKVSLSVSYHYSSSSTTKLPKAAVTNTTATSL